MIRQATARDAVWIMDLWNGVIADTLITFTTTPKTHNEIIAKIETGTVLVATNQRGFATYGPFRAGPGYAATVEHSVMIAPGVRGTGLGRALMTLLIQHAREHRKHVMVAGVSSANHTAVKFHSALGFVEVGRMPQVAHKFDQWLDLILMQRMLNPPDSCSDAS